MIAEAVTTSRDILVALLIWITLAVLTATILCLAFTATAVRAYTAMDGALAASRALHATQHPKQP